MEREDLIGVGEVARILNLSEDTITRLLRQKKMPGYKIEGSWRVSRQDLAEYLQAKKNIQQDKK